jgi:hypothetical protein
VVCLVRSRLLITVKFCVAKITDTAAKMFKQSAIVLKK